MDRLRQLLLGEGPGKGQGAWGQVLSAIAGAADSPRQAKGDRVQVEVQGVWGSLGRLLAAAAGKGAGRNLLYVTAHVPDADEGQDDLETFFGDKAALLPAMEGSVMAEEVISEIAGERLRLCRELMEDPTSVAVIIAPLAALMQPVASPAFLAGQALRLQVGSEVSQGVEGTAHWLVDQGFERVDQVDVVGQFAGRGGIVDIYGPGQDQPLRVEFFGDQIESLRTFDLDTQRSCASIDRITLASCLAPMGTKDQTSFFSYLPAETLVIMEETTEIAEAGRLYLQRVDDPKGYYSAEAVFRAAAGFDFLAVNRFAARAFGEPSGKRSRQVKAKGEELCPGEISLGAQSVQRFENQGAKGLAELVSAAQEHEVFLYCENPAQKQRMLEIMAEVCQVEAPPGLHLPVGFVHEGFNLPAANAMVISHHELFGQHQQRRRFGRIKSTRAIDSFVDLEANDLVVHVSHGIGKFRGIKALTKEGRQEEYLAIEYAGKVIIHVPASKINLVHKYVGAGGTARLSRLGSRTWERQKLKVAEAVEGMARELLTLQAHRNVADGIRFPDDTLWQREFEALFAYQETEDQLTSGSQIKEDMCRARPMDRLLCGDVGYGKTELALRATFKAIEFGKQVAVLVPTTVLAQQHYRTFRERLADFPFVVEVLSRFKTAGEAKKVIGQAARGQVDVLIGTHRLLSRDVTFKDLGLVIIDEEQRFGVAHKERLKTMRQTVDVLTLTATPIPRTLHLALLGIRDISSLATPPLDRRSIMTEVCAYDRGRIRQAILREMARGGQVYFVHNRVNTILSAADTLRRLTPEARITVAHGQMPKHELEDRMMEFVRREADVLVCSTIIESGLDIPNANTMIVNDADRFGLAQLHQLRGRVGRYKNRAYAYMLLPQKRVINPTALKRLKAIEEYSQLGSGFRIAMRDLEIRGAGNILGTEQSGQIDAVGYELYCRLLAVAVKKMRKDRARAPVAAGVGSEGETGGAEPHPVGFTGAGLGPSQETSLEKMYLESSPTHLDLQIHNHIPRSYIASDRQRMEVYRRLATCQSGADLEQLERDLQDVFGKMPRSVADLLQLSEIRMLARPWAIRSIVEHRPDLIFAMDSMQQVDALFQDMAKKVRIPEDKAVHLRLSENYFDSPATLMALLRKLLRKKTT